MTTSERLAGQGRSARPVPASSERGLRLARRLRRDPLAVFADLRRGQEPVVRLRVPLARLYLVNDPDGIAQVLAHTNHEDEKGFAVGGGPGSSGRQPWDQILGHGLLTGSADLHRRQWRLIQPMLHRARVADHAETFVTQAGAAMRDWRDGEVRDLYQDLTGLTLAAVVRSVFDVDPASDVARAIRRAIRENRAALRPAGRVLAWLPLPVSRRLRAAVQDLDAIIYRMIEDRRIRPGAGHDVLGLLSTARDEDGLRMAERPIRDEVMTLLLAGHETTANGLAWAAYLLAAHADVQRQVHDELTHILCGQLPTTADVHQLRWTTAVWRETLRLYPPAWIVPRRLATDRVIGGCRLPAGSTLLLSPWVTHRDPRWWDQPDEFRPQRWLENTDTRPRHAYFPFGGGPRPCTGNDFADLEAVLVLATILQRWDLTTPPRAPAPVPEALVTLRPRNGVALRIHAR